MTHIAQLPDSGVAVDQNHPKFAGRQFNQGISTFFGHQLGMSPGAPDDLPTPTHAQLYVVNIRTQRNISKRQGISGLNIHFRTGHQARADFKFQDENLVVLDDFRLEQIKTKTFLEIISRLNLGSSLIVTHTKDEILERSSRNVPGVKVLRSEGLNVYDILKYEALVLLEPSIPGIEGRLLS